MSCNNFHSLDNMLPAVDRHGQKTDDVYCPSCERVYAIDDFSPDHSGGLDR